MNVYDYIQAEEERKRRENEALMGRESVVPPGYISGALPTPPQRPLTTDNRSLELLMSPQPPPPREELAQRILNESSQRMPGQVVTPGQQSPQTSSSNQIPEAVKWRARAAGVSGWLQDLGRSMGQRGRDPGGVTAQSASSAVINDYLRRKQNEEISRQNTMRLALGQRAQDLEERKQDFAEQPKPVDPIKRYTDFYNMQKARSEAALKGRQVEQGGTEQERKAELVEMINAAMGKTVASMSMDEKTLNGMASDIGLDPLKLRRAKAAGGVRTGDGTTYRKNVPARFDMAGHPEAFGNTQKQVDFFGQFVHPDLLKSIQAQLADPNVSPKDKEAALGQFLGLGEDQYKKEKADAAKFVDQLQKLKGTELPTFMSSLQDVRGAMRKADPNDWNKWRSSIRVTSEGTLVADALTSSDDPAARELWRAISRLEEAYGRGQSGAAIAEEEWRNFRRQLGSGAFSTLSDLYRGVASMIATVRNRVNAAWNTIHPAIREEYTEQGRVEGWLPQKASKNQIRSFANE